MAKFVVLVNWTEAGIKDYPNTLHRGQAAPGGAGPKDKWGQKKIMRLWTLGAYDLVAIMEFPDDESAAAWALDAASHGNVRTTVMRAFDEAEMAAIIARNK